MNFIHLLHVKIFVCYDDELLSCPQRKIMKQVLDDYLLGFMFCTHYLI